MRYRVALTIGAIALNLACARRVPKPAGAAPDAAAVSWIIMSGDRENPDQDFVCQSTPRTECVVPVGRADAPVFSDVHFYFHGAATELRYTGLIQIGFFEGSAAAHEVRPDMIVKEGQDIANSSVTGVVSTTPGSFRVTFDLMAASKATGRSEPIREQVDVIVK